MATKNESKVIKCAHDTSLAYREYRRAIDEHSTEGVKEKYLKKLHSTLMLMEVSLTNLGKANVKSTSRRKAKVEYEEDEAPKASKKSSSVDLRGYLDAIVGGVKIFNDIKARRNSGGDEVVEGVVVE